MGYSDPDHWVRKLKKDDWFLFEMQVCRDWGIRHGLFMDWPPEDQAKALGLALHEAQEQARSCPRCGRDPSEWVDEDGRSIFPPPYVVEWENCMACTTLDREEKRARKQAGDYGLDAGQRAVLRPNPEASEDE